MFDEEIERPKVKAVFEPLNLENFSVDELEQYVADLESEVVRVKADMDKKKASAAAANAFFKS